jgi:two-component system chemotaxis sensor kinase CheA
LEPPERRQALGKDPVGVITLEARRQGGYLHLELADDGAGLDRDKIVARARERGLGDASGWDDRRVHALLFESGFSTAAAVTSLSGRGVGLDVVKRHVESLRGTVEVSGRRDQGTRFVLVVPISVALISCFAVEAAGQTFLVPGEAVRECVELRGDEGRSTGLLRLRDEALSWVRLGELFDLGRPTTRRQSVVVVEHGQRRAGLVVDQLLGERQTMVKPLGRLFQHARTVCGSAVLGRGQVALLLDVPSVVERACQPSAGER